MARKFFILFSLILTFFLAGCEPEPEITFTADPLTVAQGGSSTLSWQTSDADTVTIEPDIGTVAASGQINVTPVETTTYTITATGSGGTVTDQVTVTVVLAPTASISIAPATIICGDTADLSWSTGNADTISIEPGIGTVSSAGTQKIQPLETTIYTITASGPGGTTTAQASVTVDILPPTATISIDPTSIMDGESATLSWSSAYADTITIEPGIGNVQPDGSVAVTPSSDTTYTIAAIGPGGTATAQTTVTVGPPLPTAAISASQSIIEPGGTAILSWTCTNADDVVLAPGMGTVASTGSMSVSPEETTTYTITATNINGSVSDDATITVSYTPTAQIDISPQTIIEGEGATLSWAAANADTVTIEPGIGDVEPAGSVLIHPTQDTTYTLTAAGAGSATTVQTTITVTPASGPYASIFAAPQTIAPGGSSTLSWISGDVQGLLISPDIGSVDTSGSITVSPPETTTYTISGENGCDSISSEVTIIVTSAPTARIDGIPGSIASGESATLSWSTSGADTVTITPDIGNVALSGTVDVSPIETTTYAITATGPNGSATAQTTVTVSTPPPTAEISAMPETIAPGGTSTLTWNCTHADTATIEPDIGSVEISGTQTVSPGQTTTYTISVTNTEGTITAQATVVVDENAVENTIFVPKDFATIQAAVNSALDGYTVIVADGTYTGEGNKNIDFLGKNITIRSANGPEQCIIDCEGSGRGFYLLGSESGTMSEAVISGFTIINGNADNGGAIAVENADPTITACRIIQNSAENDGGGIYLSNASPLISRCTIANNTAQRNGGGVYSYWKSSATIASCDINNNHSGEYGGGLYFSITTPARVMSSMITQNTAIGSRGSGIYQAQASSMLSLQNCTIADNSDDGNSINGDGIHKDAGTLTAANCILWNNGNIQFNATGPTEINYSCMGPYNQNKDYGVGNIDSFPMFIGNGDYHLQQYSPLIDAGTAVDEPGTDIDGEIRPMDSGMDIGADEVKLGPFIDTFIVKGESTIAQGEQSVLLWMVYNADTIVIEPPGENLPDYSLYDDPYTVSPTETTTYTLTATGYGKTVSEFLTITVLVGPAPTVNFSVSPETIGPGQSATLTWSTTDADTVTIEPDIGAVDPSGSMAVTPVQTTTYTITASGPGGTAAPVSQTVTVDPNLPIAGMSVDRQAVTVGESVTLTWTTANAVSCAIEPGIGPVDLNGSLTVSPTETTTYIITATGNYGQTVTLEVVVHVYAMPEVAIDANPVSVGAGEAATLSWTTVNGYNNEIDQGVGTVDLNGTAAVTPEQSTTYTITAYNQAGTAVTDTVKVFVVSQIPKVSLSASASKIKPGEQITLSWNSANAQECRITPDIGAVGTEGTATVTLDRTTTFAITATGTDLSAGDEVTIFVSNLRDYDYGDPTAGEQLHLEYLNRARLNPKAEAARLGIILNEGLPADTISADPVQPLTFNPLLKQAACGHAQDMIANDYFAHESLTGTTPVDRANAAGYLSSMVGENIAAVYSSVAEDPLALMPEFHDMLFIDEDYPGRGHRINILLSMYKEVGHCAAQGTSGVQPYAYKFVNNFGQMDSSDQFVLGVVYEDRDENGFYSPGEGIGGVSIELLESGNHTSTKSAGGYGFLVLPGDYTILATLADGRQCRKRISVSDENVKADFLKSEFAALPAVVVSAAPRIISAGQSATLSWKSTNSIAVVMDNGVGDIPANGQLTVSPAVTTTYTVIAENQEGSRSETVTVYVDETVPAPSVSLSASRTAITIGQSVTLSWTAAAARDISIDQGIGAVASSGSMTVSPTKDTTYTITADGTGGTATAAVQVNVDIPAPTALISADPTTLESGGTATLTWSCTNAEDISILPDIGAVPPNGSTSVTLQSGRTYQITANGPGGTATGSVTIEIPSTIAIEILSPLNNTFIEGNRVTVRGTFTNATGLETGINVNGIIALIDGNRFVADRVPLSGGDDDITVTAVDTAGNRAEASIFVFADITAATLNTMVTPPSGLAPFQTTLTIELPGDLLETSVAVDGPAAAQVSRIDVDQYTLAMDTPGLYTVTVQATDSRNIAYTGTISVLAEDRVAIDTLLMGKWNAMGSSLLAGDVQGAADQFNEWTQPLFEYNFDLLKDHMTEIMDSVRSLELVDIRGDAAEYNLEAEQHGETFSFYLKFEKDGYGIWRITFF